MPPTCPGWSTSPSRRSACSNTTSPISCAPLVFAHDHGDWEGSYRKEVPTFHDPGQRSVHHPRRGGEAASSATWDGTSPKGTQAGCRWSPSTPAARRRGVGTALCLDVVERLRKAGVWTVVHIGTGGDAFHAPARRLYESLGFTGYPVVDYTKAL